MVGVTEDDIRPQDFRVAPNYPNPFIVSTSTERAVHKMVLLRYFPVGTPSRGASQEIYQSHLPRLNLRLSYVDYV